MILVLGIGLESHVLVNLLRTLFDEDKYLIHHHHHHFVIVVSFRFLFLPLTLTYRVLGFGLDT